MMAKYDKGDSSTSLAGLFVIFTMAFGAAFAILFWITQSVHHS